MSSSYNQYFPSTLLELAEAAFAERVALVHNALWACSPLRVVFNMKPPCFSSDTGKCIGGCRWMLVGFFFLHGAVAKTVLVFSVNFLLFFASASVDLAATLFVFMRIGAREEGDRIEKGSDGEKSNTKHH